MAEVTQWKLIAKAGRPSLICRYRLAGRSTWHEKSTGKTRRRDAESVARKIVAKAEEMADQELAGWTEFKLRYEKEHLSGAAKNTLAIWRTAATSLTDVCKPVMIGDINADMLSRFAVRLRDKGLSEATIRTYRAHILAALDWAVTVEILKAVPRPPKLPRIPKGTKSRGRALTREEAERIAMALPEVVGKEHARRWAWNLEGLWRSGMRITETLALYWEPVYGKHWVDDLDGKRPKIKIAAESEKGFKERTIPMAPDFVAMLRAVPPKKRTGAVFRWPLKDGGFSESEFTIGRRISKAGETANVVVNKNRDGTPKFASAHDFRRSFGSRWAHKVMPLVLKELMRHESIETTTAFYVGANTEATADALWAVQSDEIGEMLSNIQSLDPQYELGGVLGGGHPD
jgi:integrase